MGLKFSDHVVLISRPREAGKPLQRANAFVIRQTVHSPLGGTRLPLLGTDKKPLPAESHLDVFAVDPAHGAQGDPKHNHVESFVKPYFEVRQWRGDPAQTVGYELPAESTAKVELEKAQDRVDDLESDLQVAEESHQATQATAESVLADTKAKHVREVGDLISTHQAAQTKADARIAELEAEVESLKAAAVPREDQQ